MTTSQKKGRTGRRPGKQDTPTQILQAARNLFAQGGFSSSSVRAIASQAGVDPALIRHFFTNKEGLYQAVLDQEMALVAQKLSPYSTQKGSWELLLEGFMSLWESAETYPLLSTLLRSILLEADPAPGQLSPSSRSWKQLLEEQILPLGPQPLPAESRLLLEAQLLGLASSRFLLKRSGFPDQEELVAAYLPLLASLPLGQKEDNSPVEDFLFSLPTDPQANPPAPAEPEKPSRKRAKEPKKKAAVTWSDEPLPLFDQL